MPLINQHTIIKERRWFKVKFATDYKAQDVLSELRKICRGLFPLFGHIFPSQHRQPIHFPLLAGWIQTALVISLYIVSVVCMKTLGDAITCYCKPSLDY